MKKKFKFDIKGFFNKKENVAIIAVAVIFCAGLVVSNVKSQNIPLHDGDVLVDSENITKEEPADEGTSFDEKKANLELKRNELLGKYDDTIKNSSNESEKKTAVKQKERLSTYMEQEIAIETIVKSKNLPDSMIVITDNMITVTVDEQELKQDTVTKICNIVMEETKRTADKIIIQSSY